MAITASYNRIDKYIVEAKLIQPLHVGSTDKDSGEVLIHPVDGLPFVQASSLAGTIRACYKDLFQDEQVVEELFGDNEKKAGRIRITDGRFCETAKNIKMELRPRIRINPVTGTSASAEGKGRDKASGQKFETQYVGAGNVMRFCVYIYSTQPSRKQVSGAETDTNATDDQQRIEQVFARINGSKEGFGSHVQFGGQKSNGCGVMELVSLLHHTFDMTDSKGRDEWSKEGEEDEIDKRNENALRNENVLSNENAICNEDAISNENCESDGREDGFYEERLVELKNIPTSQPYAYSIVLEGRTEGALLVKSIALTEPADESAAKADIVGINNKATEDNGDSKDSSENSGKDNSKDGRNGENSRNGTGNKDSEDDKNSEDKKHAPDYVNIKNAEKCYIIPGSSVKGAVRAQFDRIASYLDAKHQDGFDKGNAVEYAFGREAKAKDTGAVGNVRFYDVLVGKKIDQGTDATDLIYNRIHIDRFTGGVMNGSLFKEQAVHGKLRIEASVMRSAKDTAEHRADISCGMLILALRDLALGMYNLGSGYSVGHGFIRADSLTVRRSDGKEAVFSFTHKDDDPHPEIKLEDPDKVVENCLKALTKMDGKEKA